MRGAEHGRLGLFVGGLLFGGLVSSGLCLAALFATRAAGLVLEVGLAGAGGTIRIGAFEVLMACFAASAGATALALVLRTRLRRFSAAFLAISGALLAVSMAGPLGSPGVLPTVRAVLVVLHLLAAAGIVVPVMVILVPARR